MIELASKGEQAFVEGLVGNWELSGEAPRLVLTIGGEDFSDRIPLGDVSHEGIAIDLEATFAGDVPLRLWGAPVTLDAAVGGVRVPMLRGLASLVEPDDDRTSTTLRAASAGAWADRYPLNETVEYSGVRPDYVVRDALRRMPYDQGAVRIQSLESPLLYFARGTEDGSFEAEQTVNDILSKVGEKVAYVYRDTAWGGHFAGLSPGLARVPPVPARMRFRAEELLFWKSPPLALEQYQTVVVFKNNPDGTPAFDPAVAAVTYVGRDFPPPPGAALPIPFTGDNPTEAWQRAYEKALELSRGLYTSEPILSFDPLLERTDVFTVTEVKDEDGDLYEREWLHYVESYEHAWSLEERGAGAASLSEGGGASEAGFQTTPKCSATLLNEERIKAPAFVGPRISAGIVETVVPEPAVPFGNDSDGFFFNPTYTSGFAGNDSAGFWIDDAAAGGLAGNDSAGFWVDI